MPPRSCQQKYQGGVSFPRPDGGQGGDVTADGNFRAGGLTSMKPPFRLASYQLHTNEPFRLGAFRNRDIRLRMRLSWRALASVLGGLISRKCVERIPRVPT